MRINKIKCDECGKEHDRRGDMVSIIKASDNLDDYHNWDFCDYRCAFAWLLKNKPE